jgi:cytochrome c556
MKRTLGGVVAVAVAILALSLGSAAVLAIDAEAVIKDRREHMKAQGADAAAIKKFIEGATDQADATKSAEDLVKRAQGIPDLFPKGTSMAEFEGKTGAKPAIWNDWDKFLAAQKAFLAGAQKLEAAVKSGNKDAISTEWSDVTKNGCGGCHTPFREKLS